MLPQKKSFKWIYVFLFIFILNLAALFFSRMLLNAAISGQNTAGFAILSLTAAIIASLGYFGFRMLSGVFIFSDIAGILYMYYIIMSGKSDGCADLTSIIGYMFIGCAGFALGLAAEILSRRIRKK
ncbi:MAG: hypothetical protein AB9844_03750 [Clostridiaceae bacterium]